jgi:hypothetical protein
MNSSMSFQLISTSKSERRAPFPKRSNFANRLSPLIFSLLASWPIALVSSLLFSNGSGVTRFSHIIPSLAKLAAKHYPIGFMAQSGRELWTTELLKFCRSTLTSPYVS